MDIEFISIDPKLTRYYQPQPTKKCLPEWFTELDGAVDNSFAYPTVKHCVPVTDMLTAGYTIKNLYEVDFRQNREGTTHPYPNSEVPHYLSWRCATGNAPGEPVYVGMHLHSQCPVQPEQQPTDYFKIHNPWIVKTPPGYSCLFIKPFYHFQSGWELLPAIVDTDTLDMPVNLTGYIKDFNKDVTIAPGDPLVQIIPFKRDSWDMKIKEKEDYQGLFSFFLKRDITKPTRLYKKLFHSKKKFN